MWMFLGQALSVVCQGVYFILLARLLGNTEYGIYVGVVALVAMASQYSALGSHSVFLRYVSSVPRRFAWYWGNVLVTTVILGSLFVAILAFIGPHISHSYTTWMIVSVAVGDCVFGQLTVAVGRVFQTFEHMRVTAAVNLLASFLRLSVAGGLCFTVRHVRAQQWVIAVTAVSIVSAAIGLTVVTRRYGWPRLSLRLLSGRTREGVIFALSYSTNGLYNDLDKVMLGHYGMNFANGIYTMAYRIVDICSISLYAVQSAALPRFFRQGKAAGIVSTRSLATSILKRTAPLSFITAAGMFLAAPTIPHLVGSGFTGSAQVLRWLCLLPLFRSFHLSAGDALSGAGHQGVRLSTQLLAAAFNFSTNFYLIPRFGWIGAAWSSLATDSILGILNWCALLAVQSQQKTMQSAARELLSGTL